MVLIEDPSCTCKMNVPNGVHTLEQFNGKANGVMQPGYRCCYFNCCCVQKRICCMITKNTVRFNCPINHVPTKDNVRVSLDIGINFHIGYCESTNPNYELQDQQTKSFFYNFGPNRLGELLQEECDEEIRDFLKKIKVSRVRDIKTELTSAMREELKKKFSAYGVIIEQVNIMNVILPRDLRTHLMHTTQYDVLLQEKVKMQENNMLIINNNENKLMLRLKRDNL